MKCNWIRMRNPLCWVSFFLVHFFGWQDIALVGEKGSGKSTLVRCLIRHAACSNKQSTWKLWQAKVNAFATILGYRWKTKLMSYLHDSIWDIHETPEALLAPSCTHREDSQFILLPWHELKRSPPTPHVPWHEADTQYVSLCFHTNI